MKMMNPPLLQRVPRNIFTYLHVEEWAAMPDTSLEEDRGTSAAADSAERATELAGTTETGEGAAADIEGAADNRCNAV